MSASGDSVAVMRVRIVARGPTPRPVKFERARGKWEKWASRWMNCDQKPIKSLGFVLRHKTHA